MTNSAPAHPTPDRLLAWRIGRLPPAEIDEVERHVADCPTCRALADALQPELLRTLLTPSPGDTPSANVNLPTAVYEMGAAPAAPTAVLGLPPELLDHPRYRVLGLLGVGGMGSVFKAEHRLMERIVALKVINRALTDNEATIERFRREVRTAARLTHPNIVTAFDAEQVGDLHFFVMEYIDGNSLDRWVAKVGPLSVEEACHSIRQTALGLQYAHERGMVHRDIKPQNLLRTRDGEIKVLDFGLARFASERRGNDALTHSGVVMGTPDYIAPEQANDARSADIRADIYSLGCTLYFLLTGRVPFPEGTTLQKFIAHLEKTPRPVRECRPDVQADLGALVARMMAKKPDDRYQLPLDVANALTPFLPGSATPAPTAAYPVELEEIVPMATLVVPEAELVEPVVRPSRARRRDWEGKEADETEIQEEPHRAARERGITAGRQLGMASVTIGLIAMPVTCISCLAPFPGGLAALGLGLGTASGYLAYKHRDKRYGWSIAGVCINLVALFMLAGFGGLWPSGGFQATAHTTPPARIQPRDQVKDWNKDGPMKDGKQLDGFGPGKEK